MPRLYIFKVEPENQTPGPSEAAATSAQAFAVRCKLADPDSNDLGLSGGVPWEKGLSGALTRLDTYKTAYPSHVTTIEGIIKRLSKMAEPDPSTVSKNYGRPL